MQSLHRELLKSKRTTSNTIYIYFCEATAVVHDPWFTHICTKPFWRVSPKLADLLTYGLLRRQAAFCIGCMGAAKMVCAWQFCKPHEVRRSPIRNPGGKWVPQHGRPGNLRETHCFFLCVKGWNLDVTLRGILLDVFFLGLALKNVWRKGKSSNGTKEVDKPKADLLAVRIQWDP